MGDPCAHAKVTRSDRWIDNWNLAIQKETSHYTTNQLVISAFKYP